MTSDETARVFSRAAWTVLPVVTAGLGHVAVLKVGILPSLAVPLDGGRLWHGKPILGPNKTWRGVILMSCLTGSTSGLQHALSRRVKGVRAPVFGHTHPFGAGAVVGLAYCLGELPNSFVKRRRGVPAGVTAGHVQYLIDQIDSVIGCVVVLRAVYRVPMREVAAVFVVGSGVHVAIDQFMYAIGVKRRGGGDGSTV